MSTIKVGTLLAADGSTTTQPSIPALDKRMAQAWINFNGEGTVAIRDSFSVSSLVDNGTGTYTINLAITMSDANYVVFAGGSVASGAAQNYSHGGNATNTTSYSHVVENSGGVASNVSRCSSIVFGN